jgi:phage-related protein
MDYEVEYYETESGTRPAEEFILAQGVKMQAKIFSALELLELKGPQLREPFSKPLGDGIFEVRAKQGTDLSRILYFFVVGKKVILTNGFVKKPKKRRPGRSNGRSDTAPITGAGWRSSHGQEFP